MAYYVIPLINVGLLKMDVDKACGDDTSAKMVKL